jgi:predicted anti-sigma-YlaC factor YlaD
MTCAELVERVTDFLDGAMDPARVTVHLESCEGCRRYVGQMRVTIQLLGLAETRQRRLTAASGHCRNGLGQLP